MLIESGAYSTKPLVTPPVLAASGSKGIDPVFGTPIMRLTDGADGSTACRNWYSYGSVFNKDSTRLAVISIIAGATRIAFFDFNPATFTAGNRRLWSHTGVGQDYQWSGLDPDVLFFNDGTKTLKKYVLSTDTITVVRDFSSELGTGAPVQWSHSMDDDVWAFTKRNASNAAIGYLVWKRSTNTVLLNQSELNVDEVKIDKSGRWLVAVGDNSQSRNAKIWDLSGTPSYVQLLQGTESLPWATEGVSHYDTGSGTLLDSDGTPAYNISFRQLNAPHTMGNRLVAYTSELQKNSHLSMLADSETWGLLIDEGPNTPAYPTVVSSPFQYEIYQVKTDGSGAVRRLVHHNSTCMDYGRNAFGNIDRAGNYIAWTSDWGNKSGRTDVYLAQISAPAPTPAPVPVDQSALVASLTAQVATLSAQVAALTAQVSTLTTARNVLAAKVDAARAALA